jgi:hypothetical protein
MKNNQTGQNSDAENRRNAIHRKNRASIAHELRAMGCLEDPYDQAFANIDPAVLGLWHLAAWYLEREYPGD